MDTTETQTTETVAEKPHNVLGDIEAAGVQAADIVEAASNPAPAPADEQGPVNAGFISRLEKLERQVAFLCDVADTVTGEHVPLLSRVRNFLDSLAGKF